MAKVTIRAGQCLTSIADARGLFWQTIWNHAGNAELKRLRKDPNILKPGDVVFVPDRQRKQEAGATEQRHRFRLKGVPVKLRLRLMKGPAQTLTQRQAAPPQYPPPRDLETGDPPEQVESVEDEPRADVPYRITIDGITTEGRTDNDGVLEVTVPPRATAGQLVVEPGTAQEGVVALRLGHLGPIDTVSGVKQRLANLAFDCGDTDDRETDAYAHAIREFQRKFGLDATGRMDDQTRRKLQEVHGE